MRANMATILDTVLASGAGGPDRRGDDTGLHPHPRVRHPVRRHPRRSERAIQHFNELLREAAAARGITVVDISPISDRVPDDPSLVASDGMHPSGKQYAGWADLVAETVRRLFREPPTASRGSSATPSGAPGASVAP